MYKIIDIREDKLSTFKGKIVSVIKAGKQDVDTGKKDYLGLRPVTLMWVLTCLVEVENER